MRAIFVCVCSLALGCGGEAVAPDAGTSPLADSGLPMDSGTDAEIADQDSGIDAATSDGGSDAGLDAGSDSGPSDAGPRDDAGLVCDYYDIIDAVLHCNGEYRTYRRYMSDVGGADCPLFLAIDPESEHFESIDDVIESDPTCESCVYRIVMGVARRRCDRGEGYGLFRAEGCPDVYRFSDGTYYGSVEEHDAAHPCP